MLLHQPSAFSPSTTNNNNHLITWPKCSSNYMANWESQKKQESSSQEQWPKIQSKLARQQLVQQQCCKNLACLDWQLLQHFVLLSLWEIQSGKFIWNKSLFQLIKILKILSEQWQENNFKISKNQVNLCLKFRKYLLFFFTVYDLERFLPKSPSVAATSFISQPVPCLMLLLYVHKMFKMWDSLKCCPLS